MNRLKKFKTARQKRVCCALPFATDSLFDRSGGKSRTVKLVFNFELLWETRPRSPLHWRASQTAGTRLPIFKNFSWILSILVRRSIFLVKIISYYFNCEVISWLVQTYINRRATTFKTQRRTFNSNYFNSSFVYYIKLMALDYHLHHFIIELVEPLHEIVSAII